MLTVGSMVASRYDFWKAQSTKWQKELNTLGDVMVSVWVAYVVCWPTGALNSAVVTTYLLRALLHLTTTTS